MEVRPVELQPVDQAVYQSIAEINQSFEEIAKELTGLQKLNFLRDDKLEVLQNRLGRIRAETNYFLLENLRGREMENAAYYDRLCIEQEKQVKDPRDVLLDAEKI